MPIQKYDPFKDLFDLQEKMHRLLLEAFVHAESREDSAGSWSPSMDIYETDDAVVVVAELPGLAREDIDIKIDHGTLVLQGERRFSRKEKEEKYMRIERHYGKFSRTIAIPSSVDTSDVAADLHNGVLEVRLPKREAARPRSIRVPIG
ncbi:MAG: Hsp20/alpha crystallin family protein [Acidobacteriota bacterium]